MALDGGTGKSACATKVMLTAAALLHPKVQPHAVEPFRTGTCTIEIQEGLGSAERFDAALIFGGDGTIHRYLPQLRQTRTPVLMVPKGSGNDFAKALGIGSERVALDAWKEFCSTGKNVREIDLGIVESGNKEIPFCCVVGAGLDAAANERANRMPRWLRGTAGYLVAALHTLPSFQPVEFTVTAGMRNIHRQAFLLAVGNAHRYGNGMKIAPRARLDDGLLDVCLVGAMNKLKLLASIPTVFFGGHLGIRQVEYFQTPEARVDAGRPVDVYADGEFTCRTPVTVRLLPRALRVIAPAPSA